MKIVFFVENQYSGGLDSILVTLINNWPFDKDELWLICNRNHPGLPIIEKRLRRSCRIVPHDLPLVWEWIRKIQHISFLWKIRRLFSPLLRYVLFIYQIFRLRLILFNGEPDRLMVVNGGYPAGESCRAATIAWGLFKGEPLSIHNFHNMTVRARWFERWAEYLIDALVVHYSEAMVAVSKACADSMKLRPAIYKAKKTTYIYDGIDSPLGTKSTPTSNLREELGLSKESFLCLNLGTYEPRKGHRFLLQAFKKVLYDVPTAYLVICGHGFPDEINQVKKWVQEFSLESHVSLLGFRNDISSLLQQTDILLVASQGFESFGLSSVEAMSHRVSVVATRVGGVPEVVKEKEGGFCVEPDDIEGYASHIIRLLRDPELRKEQGERGFQRYQQLFTGRRMALEYAELIRGKS